MASTGPKAPAGKFMVSHGIHRRTLTSRDCGEPTIHDTAQEARKAFADAKKEYAKVGYVTWFAYMYDDQGNKTQLDSPVSYN
jgi:hypothetical protein